MINSEWGCEKYIGLQLFVSKIWRRILGIRGPLKTKENSSFLTVVILLNIAICCDNKRLLTAVSANNVDMPAHFYLYCRYCLSDILYITGTKMRNKKQYKPRARSSPRCPKIGPCAHRFRKICSNFPGSMLVWVSVDPTQRWSTL